jgi:hypothetical protein
MNAAVLFKQKAFACEPIDQRQYADPTDDENMFCCGLDVFYDGLPAGQVATGEMADQA